MSLYEDLDVPRDADEATIRKAYREAAKKAHPDAGGSEDAFERIATALAVLTDPKRRQSYDETGRFDQVGPDNDRAAALQVIDRHMAVIVNAYIQDLHNPDKDPRRTDVPMLIAAGIAGELQNAQQAVAGGKVIIARLKDLERRFKVKGDDQLAQDPIRALLRRQVEQNERNLATLVHSIEVHRLAVEIAHTYDFEQDAPAPTQARQVGGYVFVDVGGPRTW